MAYRKHHLGELVSASLGSGPQAPLSFKVINAAAAVGDESDKQVADKAQERQKDVPSIWFANFPSKDAATNGSKQLADYMQNVLDYRSWASLLWYKTVYSSKVIPQDGSQESLSIQNAYAARVGVHHMKLTPWLAVSSDTNQSKVIETNTNDFHVEILKAVLAGFVDVTAGVLAALDAILTSLASTVSKSEGTHDTKMIVCERYEYIAEADVIRSFVRLISFSVTESMREVNNGKSHSTNVTCTIAYNDYEAIFNQKLWNETKKDIEKEQLDAAKKFVGEQTIDCPP